MTTGRLCLLIAGVLLALVAGVLQLFGAGPRSVLAIIVFWPTLALLVFVHVRYVAPLAQARRELLAVAAGAAPGLARPNFGRADEIGLIGRTLAALEASHAERERLRSEIEQADSKLAHALEAADARAGFIAALHEVLQRALESDGAGALHAVAESARLLLQSPLDETQRGYAQKIASLASGRPAP